MGIIDPRFGALAIAPPPYINLQEMEANRLELQSRKLKAQQQAQEFRDQQTLRAIAQQSNGDLDVMHEKLKQVNPLLAVKFGEDLQNIKERGMKYRETVREYNRRVIGDLANSADQADYEKNLAAAKMEGVDIAQFPQQFTPETKKALLFKGMTPAERIKYEEEQRKQTADENAVFSAPPGSVIYRKNTGEVIATGNAKPTTEAELEVQFQNLAAKRRAGPLSPEDEAAYQAYIERKKVGRNDESGPAEAARYMAIQQALTLKKPVSPEDRAWASAYERNKRLTMQPPVPIVVQTSTGPQIVDRNSATARPITSGGAPVQGPEPASLKVKDAAKADARKTLDSLDKDIDAAASQLGPGAGRIADFEKWVGSGNPALMQLGARMVAAKMQVDAGIGGMRAAGSPMLLKRWDDLLANKVTPASLHAVVKVMRDLVSDTGNSTEGGGLPKVGDTFQGGKVLKIEKVP